MAGGALQVVDDEPVVRLDEHHAPAARDRIRQARVGVVLGVEHVGRLVRMPGTNACRRALMPAERSRPAPPGQAVDRDRAVRRGAAEVVAPPRLRRVAVRAGIDETRLAEDGALHAQEIGVAVAAAGRAAERPDVDDQLVRVAGPADAHHRVAADGKHARAPGRRRLGPHRLEPAQPVAPQQPEQLRAPRRRPPTRNRGGRTAPPPPRTCRGTSAGSRSVSGSSAPPSASPIAAVRPSGCCTATRNVHHARGLLRHVARQRARRCAPPGRAGSAGRCRRCSAGSRWTARSARRRRASGGRTRRRRTRSADGAPVGRFTELGEHEARVEQAQRLARQVRVGREVVREMTAHERRVLPDGREHVAGTAVGQPRPVPDEQQRPAPRHQPERHFEAARPVDAEPRGVGAEPGVDRLDAGRRVPRRRRVTAHACASRTSH